MEYKAPSTIPAALKHMNKGQQHEDATLKDLQYLTSGVFRPLDILGFEIFQAEISDTDAQRFLKMLSDVRALLINVCSTITMQRNQIAMRSINQSFSLTNPTAETRYTMSPEVFASSVTQQIAAEKALKEAKGHIGKNRFGGRHPRSSNGATHPSSTSVGPTQSFFRQGPSSQQGGSTFPNKKRFGNKTYQPNDKRQ
jgi:hypothetical protein